MQCPVCHHVNISVGRFCAGCGAPMPPQASEEDAGGDAEESIDERLRLLQDEVESIRGQLRQIVGQLRHVTESLERTQGVRSPHLTPGPQANAGPKASTRQPPVDGLDEPTDDTLTSRKRVGQLNWELIVGGNWLARVGVVALIFGVAFFLKLAIDNGWLGPTARVVVGVVIGVALLVAGEYWRRRYGPFAQALSGGGIGILYLSIFAAHSLLGLIGVYVATGGLFLVSLTAVALALRFGAISLAVIGISAAFSAPFVLGVFSPRPVEDLTRSGAGLDLLAYIIVVDIGVLVLSAHRNWRWMTVLAWVGSTASYMGWFDEFGDAAGTLTAQVGLTLIYASFVATTAAYHIVLGRASTNLDRARLVLNALAYFWISFAVLWDDFEGWMGGFSLLLAVFYVGLAFAAQRRCRDGGGLSLVSSGTGIAALTMAALLQFEGSAWTTIAWSAQGVALVWASFALRRSHLRLFGYASFGLAALNLLASDTLVELDTYDVVLNDRVLAFAPAIAAMYLTAYLLFRCREALLNWERHVYAGFLGAASFFTLWVMGAEIISGFDKQIAGLSAAELRLGVDDALTNAQNLSITALLAIYAALLLAAGIVGRRRNVRLAALGLLVIPIAKVFLYDVFTMETVYRIAAFGGLGIILVVGGYAYQRFGKSAVGFLVEK